MLTLRETLTLYKTRFSFILQTIRPILICQCLALVVIIGAEFVYVDSFSGWGRTVLWFFRLAIVLLAVIQTFLYTPAAIRTFQKHIDGQEIDIKQSVLFQRMNLLSFVQLFLYYVVYALYNLILAFVPGGFLIYLATIFENSWGLWMVMPAVILGVALIVYGSYINLSKIFFPLNIYFSRGLKPLDSVQESIRLGEAHRKTVWKAVLGFVSIVVTGALVTSGIHYLISPVEFINSFVIDKYTPTFSYRILSSFTAIVIGVFAITPLTYIYMSLAYTKLVRGEGK